MLGRDGSGGFEAANVFRAMGGLGAALAPARGLHVYGFGEVVLEAGSGLTGDVAAGPVGRIGASWSTRGGRFTLHAEGTGGGLFSADPSEWLRGELGGRVGLAEDWSLTLTGHYDRAYGVDHFEGRLGLVRYW